MPIRRVNNASGNGPAISHKGDKKPRTFLLFDNVSKASVTAICEAAGISAERFDELVVAAPPPPWHVQ